MSEDRLKLSLRIGEEQDAGRLRELADYAGRHADPLIRPLRLKALNKAMQRDKESRPGGTPGRALHTAAPYGIAEIRDVPLYRYGLKDEAFVRLQRDVAALAARDGLAQGAGPALFVLWAADWFRRCYRGDGLEWDRLTDALDVRLDQSLLREVTERGLTQWRRPLKRGERARYFIGTLAREGGFPVAAVEQGGKGWARDMLARIIAPLLADPAAGREQAEAFAALQQGRITARLFQDQEFGLLCADLALAIVQIRREADGPAQAAGIPVAAWLQQHRPDWSEALPLSVSGPGADALLGELLAVEAAAVTGLNAGVERLLVRGEDGRWSEAARLTLDGMMGGDVMKGIRPDIGRLRLFASGALARSVPGELGMLEPPLDGDSGWTAHSTRRARGILPDPFATAAELELRSGEQWIGRVLLPNGKPRRGQLLVCSVLQGPPDNPEQLKVEGSGSGAFTADSVVIQTPGNWGVSVSDDGALTENVSPLGAGVGDTRLWRISGGAFVTDPDGDCYRIRTGQTRDRRDRLEFYGTQPGWIQVAGDIDLFLGSPTVGISDASRGGLFIRAIGSGEWRRAPSTLPVGHYDIGWRDGRLLLDRRRVAVLPASARLDRSGMGRDIRYRPTGWEGTALTPQPDAPVRVVGDAWIAKPPTTTRPTFWFAAMVTWPEAPPVPVRIDYPAQATIARWDGSLLPGGSQVTLADLRDLVAVDRGEMRMFGELVDGRVNGAASAMTWQFHGEMPLSSVAADIASLLLPSSGDAQVRLGMLDGIETYWHVRQFALRLQKQGGGLIASEAVMAPDVEIRGRSLADPATEVSFGPYSLVVDANHRPFTLPPHVGGGWIIYLRAGSTMLSRPELVEGKGVAPQPATALTQAMQLPPWQGLEAALYKLLATACDDDAIIAELNVLATSLNGVLPWYIMALRLLADHPAVLARMAFAATPEQRDAVMALSDALPFAWYLVPRACWQNAVERHFDGLMARMNDMEGAAGYAMQSVAMAIAALVQREPLLEHVLKQGLATFPRADIVQSFLRVASERLNERWRGSRYRDLGLALPAEYLGLPDHCLETLDTPCAAAGAVAGAWTPRADDIRYIKTVARNFPTFFGDAFAASLKEYV